MTREKIIIETCQNKIEQKIVIMLMMILTQAVISCVHRTNRSPRVIFDAVLLN